MTWTIAISLTIGFIVKIILTCSPSIVVEWFLSKFEMHSKLNEKDATITFDGKPLEGENKLKFTNYFNEATFLKKYYIFPGNEELFLHPKNSGTPLVIETKRGKKDVKIFVYCFNDHVDVVKKYKKKVVAYSLNSDNLQLNTFSMS
jgi:hypothetical protein